jgi:hypothetical protein
VHFEIFPLVDNSWPIDQSLILISSPPNSWKKMRLVDAIHSLQDSLVEFWDQFDGEDPNEHILKGMVATYTEQKEKAIVRHFKDVIFWYKVFRIGVRVLLLVTTILAVIVLRMYAKFPLFYLIIFGIVAYYISRFVANLIFNIFSRGKQITIPLEKNMIIEDSPFMLGIIYNGGILHYKN